MGTIYNQAGFVDYTSDIASVVSAINALTVVVNDLNSTLMATNTLLSGNGSALHTDITAINSTIGNLNLTVSTISTALTDATKGIYTQKVDLPYQGVYQRAMMKSTFNPTDLTNLQRAVQEENQATVFTHA